MSAMHAASHSPAAWRVLPVQGQDPGGRTRWRLVVFRLPRHARSACRQRTVAGASARRSRADAEAATSEAQVAAQPAADERTSLRPHHLTGNGSGDGSNGRGNGSSSGNAAKERTSDEAASGEPPMVRGDHAAAAAQPPATQPWQQSPSSSSASVNGNPQQLKPNGASPASQPAPTARMSTATTPASAAPAASRRLPAPVPQSGQAHSRPASPLSTLRSPAGSDADSDGGSDGGSSGEGTVRMRMQRRQRRRPPVDIPEGQNRTVRMLKGLPRRRRVAPAICARCGGRGIVQQTNGSLAPCPTCKPTEARQQQLDKAQQQEQSESDSRRLQALDEGPNSEFDLENVDWEALEKLAVEEWKQKKEQEQEERRSGSGKWPALSEEHREKIRASTRGKPKGPQSEDHKSKLRASMQKQWEGEEGAKRRLGFRARVKGRPKVCRFCGEEGHNQRSCYARCKAEGEEPKCTYCLKTGHFVRDCPVKAQAQQLKQEAAAAKAAEQRPAGGPVVASASNGSPNGSVPNLKTQHAAGSGSDSNGTNGSGACVTNGTNGSHASSIEGNASANGTGTPPVLRSAAPSVSNGGGTPGGTGVGNVLQQQSDARQQPAIEVPQRKAKRSTCSRCGSPDHQVRTCPLVNPEAAARRERREAYDADRARRREQRAIAVAAKSVDDSKLLRCGYCDGLGHNRRTCPVLKEDQKAIDQQGVEWRGRDDRPGLTPLGRPQPTLQQVPQSADGSQAGGAEASPAELQHLRRQQQERQPQQLQQQQQRQANVLVPNAQQQPKQQQQPQQQQRQPQQQQDRGAPAPVLAQATDAVQAKELTEAPLPLRVEDEVAQATSAILRAWRAGKRRQTLELMLPTPTAGGPRTPGDLSWPGGIRQQFRAARPLVEQLLRRLRDQAGFEGAFQPRWLDESDCVGAWESEAIAAVLFPTGGTLQDVREIDSALGGQRLLLVINPQWQTQGQVVSDFGFGRSAAEAEAYLRGFETSYFLQRLDVEGDDVRLLRAYPSRWQVHYMQTGGRSKLLAKQDARPSLRDLRYLMTGAGFSPTRRSLFDRLFGTLDDGGPGASSYAEPQPGDFGYSGDSDDASNDDEAADMLSLAMPAAKPATDVTNSQLQPRSTSSNRTSAPGSSAATSSVSGGGTPAGAGKDSGKLRTNAGISGSSGSVVQEPSGTFAQPGPGDFAFDGDIAPVPRGHRPGKTHVRARTRSGDTGGTGSRNDRSIGGVDGSSSGSRSGSSSGGRAMNDAASTADRRQRQQDPAGVVSVKSLDATQPAFVPGPDVIVPLQEPGMPAGTGTTGGDGSGSSSSRADSTRSSGGAAEGQPQHAGDGSVAGGAGDSTAAAASEQQQWADRFGTVEPGGEARDVIRDPVAAVRRWQEALFGADLDD